MTLTSSQNKSIVILMKKFLFIITIPLFLTVAALSYKIVIQIPEVEAVVGELSIPRIVGEIIYSGKATFQDDAVFGGGTGVWKANGNVGINTASPAVRLDVDGNSILRGNLNMDNGEINYVRKIQLQDWDDSSGGGDDSVRVLRRDGSWTFYNGGVRVGSYVDNNGPQLTTGQFSTAGNTFLALGGGNVGIGTTAPAQKLHVAGNINTTGSITWSGGSSANANSAYSHISSDGSSHSFINQSVTTASSPTFGGLTVSGTSTLSGTNTYVKRLGFNYTSWSGIGDGQATIVNENSSYKALMIVGTNSSVFGGNTGCGDTARCVRLWDRLRVEGNMHATGMVTAAGEMSGTLFRDEGSGYYVDPASTSNINSINVRGTTNLNFSDGPDVVVYGAQDGGSSRPGIRFANDNGITNSISHAWENAFAMIGNGYFNSSGSLVRYTGAHTPIFRLYINTAGDDLFMWANNTTTLAYLTTGGRFKSNGYDLFSDASLKKDIRPITKAMDKIKALEGVSFRWKNSGEPSIGFVAQKVKPVLPELVDYIEKDKLYTLNYDGIVAVLVEALKEQQAEIKKMKQDITELRQEVQKLKAR